MRLLSRLRSLWRGLTSRSAVEAEMDEELGHHVELRTRDLLAAGLSPSEAARRARVEFGSIEGVKESGRAARGLRFFDDVAGDVRYGVRALSRNPGFALVAVLTLALGIGANTAIFSVLDAVLLRPLPFANPDRLVELNRVDIQWQWSGEEPPTSMPEIRDVMALDDAFADVAAYAPGNLNLSEAGTPRRIRVGVVTRDFFATLGIQPRDGRGFSAEEGRPDGPRVALVSDAFWRGRRNAVEGVGGRSITLNGNRYAIIGVMPRGFGFPDDAEVWLPLTIPITPASMEPFRQYVPDRVIARLAPGVSIEQARARLRALHEAYERPDDSRRITGDELARPLRPSLVGESRRTTLLVLLGATGLVLLVACANVANLLLSRGAVRRPEFALRASLGATPVRVVRQLFVESLVLAAAGGGLGIAFGFIGVQLLDVLVPATLAGAAPIRVDARVLAFTIGIAATTGLAFGTLPALAARRTDAGQVLKSGGTGTASAGRSGRLRQALVLAEVALAVMLLIGSALMLRSLHILLATESGVQPKRVATLELSLARSEYPTSAMKRQFYERALDRLTAIPQVEAAGAINELPLRGEGGIFFGIYPEGRRPERNDMTAMAQHLNVTPGYFDALGIRVLRGRAPRPRPDTLHMREAAINNIVANRYWPGENPVGRRLEMSNGVKFEIVGVVDDVRVHLDQEPSAQVYYSLLDAPYNNAAIVARGRFPADELARVIERALREVAPQQAVYNVRTMEQVIAGAITPRRTNTMLITSFGLLALGLAAIGVYGVIAFSIARRTKEIGIRIALGAHPSRVRRTVMREAIVLTLIGTALGIGGAWALSDVLSSLVYGITTRDPVAFTLAPLALLAAAVLATLKPAQRATRVDPLDAIRAE